jgi:hypothetical protein
MTSRLIRGALGVLALTVWPYTVNAQDDRDYRALQVFGGLSLISDNDESLESDRGEVGWEVATTAFVGSRWLGITGVVGRSTGDVWKSYHFVAGPSVRTVAEDGRASLFAHALVGGFRATGSDASLSGPEFVVGAGLDGFQMLRLQMDYMYRHSDQFRRNKLHVSLGVVVPLCFRQCDRRSDWFRVGPRTP